MKNRRYIFTVTTGRSGQETLANLLDRCTFDTFPSFEAPMIDTFFKGKLSSVEHKIRRNYFETHELLGRGKVLKAFIKNDMNYINKIATKRIKTINKMLENENKSIYIDVSKFFIRGLHLGFYNLLPSISIINLVRDPLMNMKSFVNRRKNFNLDNNKPDSSANLLQLNSANMTDEELYLWSWFETNLRFENLSREPCIDSYVEIRTENLDDSSYLANKLDQISIDYDTNSHLSLNLNSNKSRGISSTSITERDLEVFEKFVELVPKNLKNKIHYLDNYDPKKHLLQI
jgi:hypothetical protein